MEWRDEKLRFLNLLITKGVGTPTGAVKVESAAPDAMKETWVRRFFARQPLLALPHEPRLVNRFTVGADPEFFFLGAGGKYVFAESYELTTLTAFGCDLAGRQAELRVAPSRYILELVASIVETLRWMGAAHFETLSLIWSAMPYIEGGPRGRDGAGGHVHLARKSVEMQMQMVSLDSATKLLLGAGVLNKKAFDNRAAGTDYGKWGDFRKQSFGYEYRTTPTWMASPTVAYLTLVVHKLLSYHHTAVVPVIGKEKEQIINLLRLYRGTDDDAALALLMLQAHGWPLDDSSDFKSRWGVIGPLQVERRDSGKYYYPSTIEPHTNTVSEVFKHLSEGMIMPKQQGRVTWTPFELPKGIKPLWVTPHVKDAPDIAMGLLSKYGIVINSSNNGLLDIRTSLHIPKKPLQDALPGHTVRVTAAPVGKTHVYVHVPKDLLDSPADRATLKHVLGDSSIFPACEAKANLAALDWSKWDKLPERSTIGKKLEEVAAIPEPVRPPQQNGGFNIDFEAGGGVPNQWNGIQFLVAQDAYHAAVFENAAPEQPPQGVIAGNAPARLGYAARVAENRRRRQQEVERQRQDNLRGLPPRERR